MNVLMIIGLMTGIFLIEGITLGLILYFDYKRGES